MKSIFVSSSEVGNGDFCFFLLAAFCETCEDESDEAFERVESVGAVRTMGGVVLREEEDVTTGTKVTVVLSPGRLEETVSVTRESSDDVEDEVESETDVESLGRLLIGPRGSHAAISVQVLL